MTYTNLIQILNQKFYTTTDLSELSKINDIYKALKHNSETWLSVIPKDKLKGSGKKANKNATK